MKDEEFIITKEIENLSEIENNPTKPALDIEDNLLDVEKAEQTMVGNAVVTGLDEETETLENTIAEIEAVEQTIEKIDELSEEVKDIKPKKKLKDKWKDLPKKKKIILIVVLILLIISIVVGTIFLYKHFNSEEKVNKIKEQTIFEVDNYRYENGNLILLNRDKKEIGKYECENKDENLCYVSYIDIDENLDVGKKVDEEGKLLDVRSNILKERYAFIHDSKENEIKLYDLQNSEVLDNFNGVKTYSSIEDYAIVKDNSGSYGLISFVDNNYTKAIDFNYTNMSIIEDNKDGKIIVDEDGKNYLIDYKEKALTKPVSVPIVNYNDKYLVCNNEGVYYLFDYKNNTIYEEYDYIRLVDKYVALVKDNKVFIKDYENHKYNNEGIVIKNNYKYYQKLFIYDKDSKYIDSYLAFDVVVNKTTITVSSDDKDNVISIDEGRLSALTKYVDYFEQVLYFYNDDAKENLIGTYKCTNENYLDSSSTSFEGCFVASDKGSSSNELTNYTSEGIIPIINGRYVFIIDNPSAVSEGSNTVVLYDLKNSKILGKFLAVNSNLNTKSLEVSHINKNNIGIIAKNKSNKFGVLALNDSGEMTSLVKYNYDSIELMNDNYLVKDSSGYSIVNSTGNEITKKVSEKIVNYNNKYLKTNNNGSYNIYDYDAKKINTISYKYVELYDNYFAGVDSSNKLNIYSYDKPSEAIIADGITLTSDNYNGEGNIAFKISINGTSAYVSVLTANGYESSNYSLIKNDVVEEPINIEE